MTKLETIVRNSAKKLDKEVPGWHKVIKITLLDVETGNCIVGQLRRAGKIGFTLDSTNTDRGFMCSYPKGKCECAKLTKLWKEEVRSRRKGRTGPKF